MAEDLNFLAAHHNRPLAEQDSLGVHQGRVEAAHNRLPLEANRVEQMGVIQMRPG